MNRGRQARSRKPPNTPAAPQRARRDRDVDDRPEVQSLFRNLKKSLPTLKKLLEEYTSHWGYEDRVYRFYHQSFKVYGLQETTSSIVAALQALAPDWKLNDWFRQIVKDGTGKTFEREHNKRWPEVTRPILEAFFHARYSSKWECATAGH